MPVSEAAFDGLRQRIAIVEKDQAVKAVSDANLDKRLTRIENGVNVLIATMFLAIIGAFMTFVLHGGLNVIPGH